ncbi:hypothetical protein F5ESL0233_02235 [Lactobacillus sp. ESL0233]|uniref:hypothetical protein n=1 Tax=Lactobacillus sp. ESL0233 TaxID=2069354 RepID=UPI000EFCBB9B|nr:hypothetical protein [Lactobacillus sp. ESL0233]RMC42145.1 hypothetical protein F5ESL0233_02235 [Lactobacillus sp. ESL0233]
MKLKKVTYFFAYLLSLSFLPPTLVNAEMDTASVSSNNIKAIIDYQHKTYSKSVAGFKKISP